MKEGILIINKPSGITSHDVVEAIRRRFKMKRVGHAGTLDPMATGVLMVLLGRYTKLFNSFASFDKAYSATMILGLNTDTADIQGKETARASIAGITPEKIEKVFNEFVGEIDQVPPMYSAVKVKGRKLYELARKGIQVEREARRIKINKLEIVQINLPEVKFYLECSKGTYVRQLAEDIGKRLGCGGCISQIERTQVGSFNIKDAVTIEDVNESNVRDWKN